MAAVIAVRASKLGELAALQRHSVDDEFGGSLGLEANEHAIQTLRRLFAHGFRKLLRRTGVNSTFGSEPRTARDPNSCGQAATAAGCSAGSDPCAYAAAT